MESVTAQAPDPAAGACIADRIRSRRVMFLTPVRDHWSWQYGRAMVETCLQLDRYGVGIKLQQVIGNSNLPRARNELVAEFLATGFDDAFFIDTDMVWKTGDVLRLLASTHRYIGAAGKKRVSVPDGDPRGWCCRFLPESAQQVNQDELGAIEVAGVGTGFVKIARDVFTALAEAHPQWKRPALEHHTQAVAEQYFKFFRFPEADDRGEDYALCDAWRELGGRVWVDPDISVGHVGETEFWGDISALFEKAPSEGSHD